MSVLAVGLLTEGRHQCICSRTTYESMRIAVNVLADKLLTEFWCQCQCTRSWTTY
jgi:hypothetical protein